MEPEKTREVDDFICFGISRQKQKGNFLKTLNFKISLDFHLCKLI